MGGVLLVTVNTVCSKKVFMRMRKKEYRKGLVMVFIYSDLVLTEGINESRCSQKT